MKLFTATEEVIGILRFVFLPVSGALAATLAMAGAVLVAALLAAERPASVYAVTGDNVSVAAGRISFVLGLHGPSLSVDTACSSALVALHTATLATDTRDFPGALLAAVNLVLIPATSRRFARAGMLSPDGRCATSSPT